MIRHEEQWRVTTHRRVVEVVRVYKRVVVENRTIVVPVKREELVVERVAVGDTAPLAAPNPAAEPQEHVFFLSEEEVVVQHRVVPKERIRVWVETTTEQQIVTEELHAERIHVEHHPQHPQQAQQAQQAQ